MDRCSLCENDLPKERVHLGYKECLECSETEKYASHTVYPHKTGGYIQPMSSEQADDMKRLDRRSVGGARKAKGIVADNSWDRWLKEYYNPKPLKKKFIPKAPKIIFMDFHDAYVKVINEYESKGYDAAKNYAQSLYTADKISLISKSKIINELTELQFMSVPQRKFLKKLAKKAWLVLFLFVY